MTEACPCLGSDAQRAYQHILDNRTQKLLLNESHFIVNLMTCARCGQVFLCLFTELIDWKGGEDAQARILVPIDAKEAGGIRGRGEGLGEEWLKSLGLSRRHLRFEWPTGGSQSVEWREGPVPFLPHD